MEHNLWCQRCRTLRVVFTNDMSTTMEPMWAKHHSYVWCVFCLGPLVSVTDEIKKEYPDG